MLYDTYTHTNTQQKFKMNLVYRFTAIKRLILFAFETQLSEAREFRILYILQIDGKK